MREPSMKSSVHPALGDLPVFESADLWPRIRAAHESKRRAHALRKLTAIAAAAAIVAGVVLTLPRTSPQPTVVEGQSESQTLEREWQALPVATMRPAAGLARLHVIDTALQAAYDRGAQAEELSPLWRQRNEALRGLILSARTESVIHI